MTMAITAIKPNPDIFAILLMLKSIMSPLLSFAGERTLFPRRGEWMSPLQGF